MNLYFTRSGVRLSRMVFALIAALVAAVLTVTMLPAGAFAADSEPKKSAAKGEAGGDSDGDGELDRPDGVAAAITARLSKKRVEDLSKRTETLQTFVNPDGTLTDQQYGSPVRVQDEEGAWEDVNLDLVKQADGSYVPKASPVDVTVNGGSSKEASRVTFDDGRSVAVTWPEVLPEPTVAGGVATYKLSAATDLLVSMTGNGLTTRIRLNQPPAEDDPVFTLGLRSKGVDVDQSSDGGLEFTDGKEALASTSRLVAWDAKVDDAGDPANVVELDAKLEKTGSKGDVTTHDLELTTPEGFLTDPSTEYPVTVDPDVSMERTRDTYVRNGDASHGSENKLIVGKINGSANTNPARAYLKFYNNALDNKKHTILKAELGLFQYYGYSCSDRRMYVRPVNGAWSDAITWANMPPPFSSGHGATNVETNRGAAGCAAGWTTADLKPMVQEWSNGTIDMQGVRLSAHDETLSAFERRFCSMNTEAGTTCSTAARTPYLKVTYNSAPKVPTGLKAAPTTSGGGSLWTTSAKPKVSVTVSDPEKQNVKAQFDVKKGAAAVAVPDSVFVASGGTVTKEFPPLSDGTYTIRAWASDGELASDWSAATTLKVDTTAPAAPVVTCTDATSGQWYETRPAESTTCTVAGGADTVGFDWTRGSKPQPAITATGGNATLGEFDVLDSGVFGVSVRARDAAGNLSLAGTFGFGTGKGGVITPVEGERTSSTVTVEGEGPEGASGARIEYQPVGSNPPAWVTATQVKATAGTSWLGWFGTVTPTGRESDSTGKLIWDISAEPGIKAPAVRETRICFTYSGVDSCTPTREVTVVPSAFGSSFPTQEVGPGQVALFTGEFQFLESDVEVPAYSGTLSLGRSHRSYAGDVSPAQGVFGPGWVADLTGPDAGVAGLEVVDNTTQEASITLVGPGGSSSTYVHEQGIASAQRAGVYVGDAETETDNDVLEISTEGSAKYLTLLEQDETETTWKLTGGKWLIEKVDEPGDTGVTTYTHDSEGMVTRIYAPSPPSVTCNATTQTAGCRALWLTYTGMGAAKRLSQVDLRIWDPKPTAAGTPGTTEGMVTVPVQKYAYNTDGTLKEAWDPRLDGTSGSLKTAYEYSTIGTKTVLSKVTPPGQTPWRFDYETSGAEAGMFKTARRAQVAPLTGDATWTVVYGTQLSGTGLPNLNLSATSTWGQDAAPVAGASVFGPDAPGTSDPTYGTNSYWDVEGRTTNTATYGAGDWQIDSIAYDANGNKVWALDEGNRSTARASEGDTAAVANSLSTQIVYNEEAPGIPAGTRVEKTFGPTRDVVLKNGTQITGRSLDTTVYDDEAATDSDPVPTPGRPTPGLDSPALNLPVEERSATVDAAGIVHDITKTRMRYDPVVAGDGDGWVLGTPTRTTVAHDTSVASTTLTRFDTEGKIIETRTPEGVAVVDGTANDARSTKTIYYTADTSAIDPECREKPEWAGQECSVRTGDITIPRSTTIGYDYLLNPTRTVHSVAGGDSPAMSRTFIVGYDPAGRRITSSVLVAGAPDGDKSVPDVTYAYSPTNGALVSTATAVQSQTTLYDAWARATSQTDGAGNTAISAYDNANRLKTFNDGKGIYTYTYDGVDAAGKAERRGLVTKLDVGLPSGPDEFKIASNADGDTYLTEYPNGMKATTSFDASGAETALSYVDSTNVEVVGFANTLDTESRIRIAESTGSTQSYTYDHRDRLIKVEDTAAGGCVTRQYGFTLDSNRSSLSTTGPDVDGACSTAGSTTETTSFDNADRITGSTLAGNGYVYDSLGRTRTVPKAHTDQAGALAGDLAVDYHSNDMVAKLSQTVPDGLGGSTAKTKTFTLDPSLRLSATADTVAGVEVRKMVNHYANSGDSPAWSSNETRVGSSAGWVNSWSRNVLGPDGDLAMIQGDTGTPHLQIVNLHGDVVAQIPNTSGAIEGIEAWAEFTEYGLARSEAVPLGQGYGPLGAKRRSTDTIGGVTLMGARLYNPTTGRFLSRDPIPGGNDNSYVYPADPVNQFDLSGEANPIKWLAKKIKKLYKKLKGKVKKARNKFYKASIAIADAATEVAGKAITGLEVLSYFPYVGAYASGALVIAYLIKGKYKKALSAAAGLGGGKLASKAFEKALKNGSALSKLQKITREYTDYVHGLGTEKVIAAILGA